jgi:hypothetical protein
LLLGSARHLSSRTAPSQKRIQKKEQFSDSENIDKNRENVVLNDTSCAAYIYSMKNETPAEGKTHPKISGKKKTQRPRRITRSLPLRATKKKGPLTFGCGTRTDGRTDGQKKKSHSERWVRKSVCGRQVGENENRKEKEKRIEKEKKGL